MHRPSHSEGQDLGYDDRSRSQSMSSDRPSLSGLPSFTSAPRSVNPEPGYIAASAAAQIVTSKRQDHVQDWLDEIGTQPSNETAMVSPASLMLVNSFLDHLLYNFLFIARSTSLAALRPAVSEVLRPRLATEAIAGADQELHEFLGGGDDEMLSVFHNGKEPGGDGDIELVWKRTRLRCMVYTRLGDMEEEEEDEWVERDCLEDANGMQRRFSRESGVVSPAVAIFLTSILEFIGEHALMVAGEATYARILKSAKDPAQSVHLSRGTSGRLVVEELDMEKVAFNTTLGRLWRTWRKRIRSPMFLGSRTLSRDSTFQRSYSGPLSGSTSRKSSIGAADDSSSHLSSAHRPLAAELVQRDDPASIPLPMTDNDVQEIESPTNAFQTNGGLEDAQTSASQKRRRPRSMLVFPSSLLDPPMSETTRPLSQNGPLLSHDETAPSPLRNRSFSLPGRQQASNSALTGVQFHSPISWTARNTPYLGHKVTVSGMTPSAGQTRALEQEFPQRSSREEPSDDGGLAVGVVDTEVEKHGFGDEEPQILRYTRISMEGAHSPIEIVQTRSRAASSTRSFRTSETSQTKDRASQENPWSAAARSPSGQQRGVDGIQSSDVSLLSEAAPSSPSVMIYAHSSGDFDDDPGYFAEQNTPQWKTKDELLASKSNAPVDEEVVSEKRNSRFALPSPLPSPSQRGFATSAVLTNSQPDGTLMVPKKDSPTSSVHRSGPALTPLREMTEDCQEDLDEATLPLPSTELRQEVSALPAERSRSSPFHRADSYSSAKSGSVKHSSSGSKRSDRRNEPVDVQPSFTDTGASQKCPSPRTSPVRRPGSSGGNKRSAWVSTAGTPQTATRTNGFTERRRGASESSATASRTPSQGSASMTSEKHSQTVSRPDDKQRSFEQLIRSDETIQYTLTPQNMRDMESPEPPTWASQHSITSDAGDITRNVGQIKKDHPRPTTARSRGSKSGPQADAGISSSQQGSNAVAATTSVRNKSVVKSSASPNQTTQARPGMPTARDARIQKESVRDLADFIRSTGPEKDVRSVPFYTNSRPTTGVNTGAPTNVKPLNLSPKRAEKSVTGADLAMAPQKGKTAVVARSGSRPQARDATVPYGAQSSDLIDFIRQGPPHERDNGTHRIPRTVAPFRSTMDSDEINTGMAQESVASTQNSLVAKSIPSSANSRTGLLDTTNRPNVGAYNAMSGYPSHSRGSDPPRPQRKQRRVRDPYAIDSDSDEDLNLTANSATKRGEESLIDFLRNVPAPASPTALQSAFDDIEDPKGKTAPRKFSAPNLKTRFTRTGSASERFPTARTDSAGMAVAPSKAAVDPPQHPQFRPRATSDNLLNKTGPTSDTHKSRSPTYATHVSRERNLPARTSQRVPVPLQARSGRINTERSSDLADFLKNSGPPPTSQSYAPSVTKEEGGFTRMFSRRKKSAGLVH